MCYMRFFYLKMSEWLIPSFLVSDVSESLRLLTKNEGPWAIRSCCSEEMSDHERISQVAHLKLANEWIAHLFWAYRSFAHFWAKKSNSLGKPMSEVQALVHTYKYSQLHQHTGKQKWAAYWFTKVVNYNYSTACTLGWIKFFDLVASGGMC